MYNPIVHGGDFGDFNLLPNWAKYLFLPSLQKRQFAFVIVNVKHKGRAGKGHDGEFTVMIQVPLPPKDSIHYDLVYQPKEGNKDDKVGLRPWKNGAPDPQEKVYWRKDFHEPDEWHPGLVVTYGTDQILGAFPVVRIAHQFKGLDRPYVFLEWATHWQSGKYYGTESHCIAPVNVIGRDGVEATLAALKHIQALILQVPEKM